MTFPDDHPDHPDAETLLRRVAEIVNNAKSMPLSSSVMISRDEVIELLEEAIDRLPEELRQSRWLLKEREDFLAKVQREADDILEAARGRAERMVQRTEIVREAKRTAQRLVEEAQEEASGERGSDLERRLTPMEQPERDRLQPDRVPAKPTPQAEQQEAAEEPFPQEEVKAVGQLPVEEHPRLLADELPKRICLLKRRLVSRDEDDRQHHRQA